MRALPIVGVLVTLAVAATAYGVFSPNTTQAPTVSTPISLAVVGNSRHVDTPVLDEAYQDGGELIDTWGKLVAKVSSLPKAKRDRYIANVNLMAPTSGLTWADVIEQARVNGDVNALAIQGFNVGESTEQQIRHGLEGFLGKDRAQTLPFCPTRNNPVNSAGFNGTVKPFVDTKRQLRVSLFPLVMKDGKQVPDCGARGGILADCGNPWGGDMPTTQATETTAPIESATPAPTTTAAPSTSATPTTTLAPKNPNIINPPGVQSRVPSATREPAGTRPLAKPTPAPVAPPANTSSARQPGPPATGGSGTNNGCVPTPALAC